MFTIFLDLDGTLIDPKPGITAAIRHALSEMNAPEIPLAEELTWCIGPPLWSSFEILLGPGADVEAAVAAYRAHYTDEGMYDAELYDGVGEMFETLHDLGARAFVATSKPAEYAAEVVEHFGIHAHVERLFGSELDGRLSDKTELLAHALSETETDPARAVMLGDRRFDIHGARNNLILSIGAMWGYAEAEELHLADAEALAGAPEEVPEIALDLLGLAVD